MLTGLQRMYKQQECVGTKTSIEAGSPLGAEMRSGVGYSKQGNSLKTEQNREDAKPPCLFLHAIFLRFRRQ